jgi:hypothetical protein
MPSKPMLEMTFEATGYSDDCASMTGADPELSEGDVAGAWFELVVGHAIIGACRMVYRDGRWRFEAATDGFDFRVGRRLDNEKPRTRGGKLLPP